MRDSHRALLSAGKGAYGGVLGVAKLIPSQTLNSVIKILELLVEENISTSDSITRHVYLHRR